MRKTHKSIPYPLVIVRRVDIGCHVCDGQAGITGNGDVASIVGQLEVRACQGVSCVCKRLLEKCIRPFKTEPADIT